MSPSSTIPTHRSITSTTDAEEIPCEFEDPAGISLSLTPACYEINTDANVCSPVNICIEYTYAELGGRNPAALCILHCDNAPGEVCSPEDDCLTTVSHDHATESDPIGRICAEADVLFPMSLKSLALGLPDLGGAFMLAVDDSDPDLDGLPAGADNCPAVFNPSQSDGDSDGVGNACDNCPDVANPDRADADQNGVGDACESNNCCEPHAGPTCTDSSVTKCVCAADPYCCTTAWDQQCVNEVESLQCGVCPDQPAGSCCTASTTPSCQDQSVALCVCAVDPYCCNTAWDQQCVNEVQSLQCGVCQ